MKWLIIMLSLINFISYGQPTNKPSRIGSTHKIKRVKTVIQPFELTVYNSDYSLAYALQYVLTDKDLKIIFKAGLVDERDSTFFTSRLKPSEQLQKLSILNIDSLKEYYVNPCIDDGSQLSVKLDKDHKSKTVQLSNYYQNDIGLAISLINSIVPQKYKIWYDKKELINNMKRCKL